MFYIFVLVFRVKLLDDNLSILIKNPIISKFKDIIKVYTFTLSIYNKNSTGSNTTIFENLNIIEIRINKTNL